MYEVIIWKLEKLDAPLAILRKDFFGVVQQVLQICYWDIILVQQVLQSGAFSLANGATSYAINT
jgi:hypothetical protein